MISSFRMLRNFNKTQAVYIECNLFRFFPYHFLVSGFKRLACPEFWLLEGRSFTCADLMLARQFNNLLG